MMPRPLVVALGAVSLCFPCSTAWAGALELDGSGDFVTFPGVGIPIGSSPFTIESWINPTSIPGGGGNGGQITFWGTQGPANTANGFRLRGGGGARHYFWGNDHDENFGIDILPDATGEEGWHHLAVTYDGSQTRWYWNGAPLGSPRSAGVVNVADGNFRIGSRINDEFFDGFIDEIRIWDKARSGVEIADDFDQELTGGEANLVAYFDFEGDYGDRAGGDNDGTPVGDASINGAASAPVGSSGGPVIESFATTHAARFEGESATLSWVVDPDLVSGSLLVEILDDGDTVIHSTADETGSFPITIGDTGGSVQDWTYTLRAGESGGAMISRESTVEIAVDPGIPIADAQSQDTVTTTPVAITLTGSDPNAHPDPLTFSVVDGPAGGSLAGVAPDLTYTAAGGFTGSDTFTFRASDGRYESDPATVTINVAAAPAPPTDLALSTANIGEDVSSGGFIATISTTDPNPEDTHTYSLVGGAGADDNALFSIVGNQLRAATNFAGQVGNSYSIRLRTLDSGGLSYEESVALTVVMTPDDIVINEIHYNPPENTVRQEFIELYNPSDASADLAGWRLSGAVDFIFPDGTSIPAGGYLVVGEDPATLLSTLNVSALGPFAGSLSSDGETVRLRDPDDNVIDAVDYKVGFPWPVAADGGGASIELISPDLDNSLGSSWRSSIPQAPLGEATLLPLADSSWSWRDGSTEASDPAAAWREQGFVEDGSWNPGATLPIGYGTVNGVAIATEVGEMRNNYRCIFLRNTFAVAPGEMPAELRINYTADDGIVVWINGVEVARARFDADEVPTIDSLATANGPEGTFESQAIINPGAFLVEGDNTIAVQVFNVSVGSSDLGFDLEIVRPGQADSLPLPSPGARNTAFAGNAAPNIRKVEHSPQQPLGGEVTTVTARVTDPEGVAAVSLEYQVVEPGAYIPAFLPHTVSGGRIQNFRNPRTANPAYGDAANWTSVTMVDDGTGADDLAGDDVYTVQIPARPHRHLVRYRITVEDGLGLSARWPYLDDASLNFAYFHYDGVPDYNGHPASDLTQVPVYHILTRAQDWSECYAWNNSSQQIGQGGEDRFYYNWNGTIVYDGVVYDNIRYRLRGANGRYQLNGKRHMRFRLNDGYYLQAHDIDGNEYGQKWRTLTTHRNFGNRLTMTHSLNDAVNMRLFRAMGVHAQYTGWMHMRVIDSADEAPDPWHGDFWGLHGVLETYDVRFLEEHDIPKGNLYKLINQTSDWERQQRYQHAFAVDDGSDHDNIEGDLTGSSGEQYIRDHVDLRNYHAYHAVVEAIRHYDYWPNANKNMVYYFSPEYTAGNSGLGKLMIFPWDTDATWGPTYNSGHDVVYNAIFPASGGGSDGGSTPALWPEHHNVVRELRDLLWQRDQIEPLIDEYATYIEPIMAADFDRWRNAPASAGNYNGAGGAGLTSLAAYVQDMKNFAFSGGSWPGGGVPGPNGRAAHLDNWQGANGQAGLIPNTPTITYTGAAGFPTDGISFQSSSFSDPQGAGTFGAMQWRVAQITDETAPNHDPADRFKLEIEADWESGELPTFNSAITIPTVAVRSGYTYRARVRHMDDTGRWSHWSEPVEFTASLPDISAYLSGLVVSEVMYHPADPTPAEFAAGFDDDDFFEFIEIKNVGDTTLDLTDVRFTKGVDFDFLGAAVTSLAPGELALVVRDLAAFEARYGVGQPVAGAWEDGDRLGNGGERLKLSFGAGDAIRDFVYDDTAPWPTAPDGSGASLTLVDPGSLPDHALPASWRASFAIGGTPGGDESGIVYDRWRDEVFGPGQPPGSSMLEDADADGVSNLEEYALGGDPLDPSSRPAVTPGVVEEGGEWFLTLSYTTLTRASDIELVAEVSTDLDGWGEETGLLPVGSPVDNGDGSQTVVFRHPVWLPDAPRRFLRMRVLALDP